MENVKGSDWGYKMPISKFKEVLQDRAAEGAVIGSMLLDPKCIPQVIEFVEAEDFATPGARYLFGQILSLWKAKLPVDAVLIRDSFNSLPEQEQATYFEYMKRALTTVPSAANAVYYSRLVYRKNIERKLIEFVEELRDAPTLDDKLDLIGKMTSVSQTATISGAQTELSKLIDEHLLSLENEGGISTGFSVLDRAVDGFGKDNLILIAGRPAMGKSSLMLDFFIHTARLGAKPYLYSLEMAADKIIQRMLRNVARYKHSYYNKSAPEIIEASNLMKVWPAWVEQKIDFRLEQLCLNIIAQKERNNIGVCFIDYLNLIETKGRSKYEQITNISRELKKVAITTHIPIVALSQLNRACELRTNHRPFLSDLRDSGGIEQDADIVMFLHREDYYRQKENPDTELDGKAQCIIAKNREGRTGDIEMIWLPECSSFSQLNEDEVWPESVKKLYE